MGGRRSTHHPESETSMKSTAVYSLKLVKDRTVRFPISDVNTPTQSALLVHRLIADAPSEHMVVVFLDANMKVIGTTIAISGGSHGLMVMPKDIFRAALAAHASGIVLGHNHPSGDTTPSKDDIATTLRLIEAGKLLGIQVMDHVIVAMDRKSYSMFEHNTVDF